MGLYFDTNYTIIVPIILTSIELLSKYCFIELEKLILPETNLINNDLNYYTYCFTLPVLFFCLTYEVIFFLKNFLII